jgi:hypothetical protein
VEQTLTAQAAQAALTVQAAQFMLTSQAGQVQSALTVQAAQAMLTAQAAQAAFTAQSAQAMLTAQAAQTQAALTAQAAAALTAQAQEQQQAVQQQDGVWNEVPDGGTTNVALAAINFNDKLYVFAKGIQNQRVYINSTSGGANWSLWSEMAGGGTTDVSLAPAVLKINSISSPRELMTNASTSTSPPMGQTGADGAKCQEGVRPMLTSPQRP